MGFGFKLLNCFIVRATSDSHEVGDSVLLLRNYVR